MGKMSLGEALAAGLETTVIGLTIVFAVLIILMLVLVAMKYIFGEKKTAENKPAPQPVKPAAPAKTEKSESDMPEEELIAVLTAAVAASLNTSTYNLRIKSYRRIGNNAPAWNKAGLNDVLESRY